MDLNSAFDGLTINYLGKQQKQKKIISVNRMSRKYLNEYR